MNYTATTLLKAGMAGVVALIAAAVAAAGGPDLSELDLGQWLESLAPALVAVGALLHQPEKKDEPATKAVTSVTEVLTQAAEAQAGLAEAAVASIQRVQEAAGDLTKLLPLPDPAQLAKSVIVTAQDITTLGPLSLQAMTAATRL